MEREQVIRIDCPDCGGKGYKEGRTEQTICERCEGGGELQKTVPYKFETRGQYTAEEKAEIFGVDVDTISTADSTNAEED